MKYTLKLIGLGIAAITCFVASVAWIWVLPIIGILYLRGMLP